MTVLVDANILLRLADPSNPAQAIVSDFTRFSGITALDPNVIVAAARPSKTP